MRRERLKTRQSLSRGGRHRWQWPNCWPVSLLKKIDHEWPRWVVHVPWLTHCLHDHEDNAKDTGNDQLSSGFNIDSFVPAGVTVDITGALRVGNDALGLVRDGQEDRASTPVHGLALIVAKIVTASCQAKLVAMNTEDKWGTRSGWLRPGQVVAAGRVGDLVRSVLGWIVSIVEAEKKQREVEKQVEKQTERPLRDGWLCSTRHVVFMNHFGVARGYSKDPDRLIVGKSHQKERERVTLEIASLHTQVMNVS